MASCHAGIDALPTFALNGDDLPWFSLEPAPLVSFAAAAVVLCSATFSLPPAAGLGAKALDGAAFPVDCLR